MTGSPLPSRVFVAALDVYDRLLAEVWPVHDVLGSPPQIAFANAQPDSFAEIVQVVPDVGEDSTINWRSVPGGRDEEFGILFLITTATGAVDQREVVARLAELSAVVERAFYDDLTGVVRPIDVPGALKLDGVDQVSFKVLELDRIDGYAGQAVVSLRSKFRI